MIRKTLLFVTAFMLLMACNSNSQQRKTSTGNEPERRAEQETPFQLDPEQMAERMAKRMKSELQLTDKQTEEIKTFFSSYHRERQKEFDKSKKAGQDREARRAAMVKNRAAMDDKIKSVLTEEQYKKYKENEEKRRGEAAQRGQRMRGEGRPNR